MIASSSACGGRSAGPGLQLTYISGSNRSTQDAAYKLSGNRLVLDYGGPCDAPVDTYERVR
ncbi:hypothetical protein [Hymenobacter saemangeumensis]|uniref:hypothetical protein n=1 Tax=Hymenobacter saemangeumensis TaxID=1084522 RepID=UPI0031E71842